MEHPKVEDDLYFRRFVFVYVALNLYGALQCCKVSEMHVHLQIPSVFVGKQEGSALY